MKDDCEHCGALWNRHTLSATRPTCKECARRICSKCESTECEVCQSPIHDTCASLYGNEHMCAECHAFVLKMAVAK